MPSPFLGCMVLRLVAEQQGTRPSFAVRHEPRSLPCAALTSWAPSVPVSRTPVLSCARGRRKGGWGSCHVLNNEQDHDPGRVVWHEDFTPVIAQEGRADAL